MARGTGFLDNLLGGFISPKGNLGDYQHAARLYVDNNMRLSPKFKHLYHVVLNINPNVITNSLSFNRRTINVLAKSADLPKYRVQTQTLNQYNRKKVIQTGVQYQPISIEYHDDNAGLTTRMWEAYFRWYYQDSNYAQVNADGTPKTYVDAYSRVGEGLNRTYGASTSQSYRFGLDRPNKTVQFFDSITIFQLHPLNGQSTYTAFTLINPYIESYEHDNVTQEGTEFTVNRFSVAYESVLYNRGDTRVGNAPAGFGEIHYDKAPSSLSIVGERRANLFGTDSFTRSLESNFNDLTSGNFFSNYFKNQKTSATYENANKTTTFPGTTRSNTNQIIANQRTFD